MRGSTACLPDFLSFPIWHASSFERIAASVSLGTLGVRRHLSREKSHLITPLILIIRLIEEIFLCRLQPHTVELPPLPPPIPLLKAFPRLAQPSFSFFDACL